MERHARSNLNALRLAAATAVVLSHAFQVTGATDPLAAMTGTVTLGVLAVWVFFCLSGYLVTDSWTSDARVPAFAARRALRIVPGLAVVVAATILVAGPLLSGIGARAYFASRGTWQYATTLGLFWQQNTLPGVFTANPWVPDVNASLWTLRYDVLCYALVPILAARAARESRVVLPVVLGGMLALLLVVPIGRAVPLPGQLELRTLATLTSFFGAGVGLRCLRARIALRGDVACLCACVVALG